MDGIVFRTTDGARWGGAGGLGTGGNLTPLQFDENMWAVLTRIQALENDPPLAISVSGFTVIGSQFLVNMSDASTRGPFDLPIATFRLVGEWVNSMPLLKLDVFSAIHFGLFFVNIAHTTPATPAVFDPAAIDEDSGSPTFGNPLYTQLFGEDEYVYDVGFFFPGRPGIGIASGGPIAGHVFIRKVLLPAGLTESRAVLGTAPGAPLSFQIQIDGVTKGTVDFATGAIVGTFTFTDDVNVVIGQVLTVKTPAPVDSAARDLSLTFKANRVFT